MTDIKEDAPVNSAGNGGVDGIGIGPKGEPGGKKSRAAKILRRKKLNEGYGGYRRRFSPPLTPEQKAKSKAAMDRALAAISSIKEPDNIEQVREKHNPGYAAFKKRYDARKEAEKKSHPNRFQN